MPNKLQTASSVVFVVAALLLGGYLIGRYAASQSDPFALTDAQKQWEDTGFISRTMDAMDRQAAAAAAAGNHGKAGMIYWHRAAMARPYGGLWTQLSDLDMSTARSEFRLAGDKWSQCFEELAALESGRKPETAPAENSATNPAAATHPTSATTHPTEDDLIVADMANMSELARLCTNWAIDHDNAFPQHLWQAAGEFHPHDPETRAPHARTFWELLIPSRSTKHPLVMTPDLLKKSQTDPVAFTKEFDAHSDFVYLANGLNCFDTPSIQDAILLYENPAAGPRTGISAAFYDGHAEIMRWEGLHLWFKTINDLRKKHHLPEVDLEALLKQAPPHL